MNAQLLNAAQPPALNIAAPLNDTQLVALVAAQLDGDAAERVSLAVEIVAEACVKVNDIAPLARQKAKARSDMN